MQPERLIIFDTTLRDGEQCPGASMNNKEKLEIARQLSLLKVDVIEAGFPVASPGDFESVQQVANEIKGSSVAGLARALEKDVEAAARALEKAESPRIHIFLSTSKLHRDHKLQKGKDEVIQMAVNAVKFGRKFCRRHRVLSGRRLAHGTGVSRRGGGSGDRCRCGYGEHSRYGGLFSTQPVRSNHPLSETERAQHRAGDHQRALS